MKSISSNMAKSITRQDYYQIVTSILMTILGGIILGRTLLSGIFILPLLVGGGLLGLGIYRLSFVVRYFRNRKK